MLTSTYTLVALAVEQTALRTALHALGQEVGALPDAAVLAPGRAAQLCTHLRQVYDSCHWRKLDKFLLPALRRTDAAVDALLRELESLSGAAADAMAMAEECVAGAERVVRAGFAHAVARCIEALRRRLEREEKELFPLARTVVGGDAWFSIAHQMLAHDAYTKERRSKVRGTGSGSPMRFDPRRFDPSAADVMCRQPALSSAH